MSVSGSRGTVIVANGPISDLKQLNYALAASAYIVAVDGGGNAVADLGYQPSVLLGDFDSISSDNLQRYRENGVQLIAYEPEKDETDLQLALEFCLQRGYNAAIVFGALGGRPDHLISNLSLLAHYNYKGIECQYIDGPVLICAIVGEKTFEGKAGDTLSLFPVGYRASGIDTRGLRYPLHDGTLVQGVSPIGVSNILTEDFATVSVSDGELLAVHIKR